jgi:hypothetical protein
MNTLLLQVNNQPVLNLLYEMQALNLVKVLNDAPSTPLSASSTELPSDEWDIKQVLKRVKEEDVQQIKQIFEPYLVNMNGFKFNREEANNYD